MGKEKDTDEADGGNAGYRKMRAMVERVGQKCEEQND
jgi:hypothetical protein